LGSGLLRCDLREQHRAALFIVDEDGSECKRTFKELALRSNQVANYLRTIGVRRGDHILLMLGNQAALWELLLAGDENWSRRYSGSSRADA